MHVVYGLEYTLIISTSCYCSCVSFNANSQEANSTFRILLNESTRRLKLLSKKLGSSIEKSRPYYDSLDKARAAQVECQLAAAKFRRANGMAL